MKLHYAISVGILCWSGVVAADVAVTMNNVDAQGTGASVGIILVSETPYGVLFTPALTGLPPGAHGFHLHENASCAPKEKDGKPVAALAAGGHFDPAKTGNGKADSPVLAPRLKLADLAGHALMIHAGGDNHADHPAALGGGGARMACGVVNK
jgi:Cu-Zn family superoxide dismutase